MNAFRNILFMSLIVCLNALAISGSAWAQKLPSDAQAAPPPIDFNARLFPVMSEKGMVAAQDFIAAEVGAKILSRGGNAVDAAVATGFALAVTHPQAGNIGGGGFMMIALDGQEEMVALDFREMAPASAHPDIYLDQNGQVDNRLAQNSHQSAGVPGSVMGLLHALDTYGTMNRDEVISPAISLAEKGFLVAPSLSRSLALSKDRLAVDPSSIEYFYDDGATPRPGYHLKQTDLAKTLRRIAKKARTDFTRVRPPS